MKKNNYIHILIIIIGSIFIFLSIIHKNLWFDELYSVEIVNYSYADIWKIGSTDVHPILYYYLLHLVKILTNGSILAYRIFSVLPIVLLGILGITHIKKDFGIKTGILFSFFSYFLPVTLIYVNQIRMYTWAIYLVAILAIYAYRLYKGQVQAKNWIIFTLASLLCMYIHYYGLICAFVINLFLLIYFLKNNKWREVRNILFFRCNSSNSIYAMDF